MVRMGNKRITVLQLTQMSKDNVCEGNLQFPYTHPLAGFYRHYKGNLYKLVADLHLPGEEHVVLYQSEVDRRLWLRPYKMFFEYVEMDGNYVPRFEKVNIFS